MKVHLFILILIVSWLSKKITSLSPESRVLGRRGFPDNFVFGTAASAFQVINTSVGTMKIFPFFQV